MVSKIKANFELDSKYIQHFLVKKLSVVSAFLAFSFGKTLIQECIEFLFDLTRLKPLKNLLRPWTRSIKLEFDQDFAISPLLFLRFQAASSLAGEVFLGKDCNYSGELKQIIIDHLQLKRLKSSVTNLLLS